MLNISHIEVRESTEPIASCNSCGAKNYIAIEDAAGAARYEATGLKLWELRVSANGYQATMTMLCGHCALEIGRQLKAAVLPEADGSVVVKEEHYVTLAGSWDAKERLRDGWRVEKVARDGKVVLTRRLANS